MMKVKRSELDEQNTLVLNPRNSLDSESSLKRDIDEYMRVMEKQEQLIGDSSRRNSINIEEATEKHQKNKKVLDQKLSILQEDCNQDNKKM